MILSYKRILNITFCILGFFVFILGCEDKKKTTALHEEIAVAGNVTILDIKENYKTLNVQSPVLRATIIESKDVTNYTYLLLEDKTGKVWAAIPKTPVKTGDEITITNIAVMKDFHSKTLEKTFDLILFAVPSEGCPFKESEGEIVSEMPSGMMPGKMPQAMMSPASMPHGAMPAMGDSTQKSKAAPQDIKVSKAVGENAYTIEEIYSKKEELSQKTITVQAIVVKFMPQVMGKNWIHIQDGTGNAENGNNDISVSTLDTAEVGDEVIIKGTLGINKDFGMSCAFGALIEEASITPSHQ
ncbi:MAG: nucleotide-binding protein [Deltaproteobacteria bacterium]|nr:nucleotide-binding protein [Deltaproteobacteria bacterium]